MRGVKRFEGEEQVAGGQKWRAVAVRKDREDLNVEDAREAEPWIR